MKEIPGIRETNPLLITEKIGMSKEEEFIKILENNKRLIFKVSNAYCKNSEDRKDLGQEIVFHLWKSYERYNPQYRMSTWIYRIALNVSISFFRRNKATRLSGFPVGEEVFGMLHVDKTHDESDEDLRLLHQFLDELKEIDKALMILYLEEKNYKEISEILGISESNVGTKISRIKKVLSEKFSKIK